MTIVIIIFVTLFSIIQFNLNYESILQATYLDQLATIMLLINEGFTWCTPSKTYEWLNEVLSMGMVYKIYTLFLSVKSLSKKHLSFFFTKKLIFQKDMCYSYKQKTVGTLWWWWHKGRKGLYTHII